MCVERKTLAYFARWRKHEGECPDCGKQMIRLRGTRRGGRAVRAAVCRACGYRIGDTDLLAGIRQGVGNGLHDLREGVQGSGTQKM